jgi:phage repressor protein C with HTH and peptisase S24 domain
MLPVFAPEDHVLTFNWADIGVGDVVVFELKKRNYLKRVKSISGEFVRVFGDNRKESSKIASIKKEQIIGKVVFKY